MPLLIPPRAYESDSDVEDSDNTAKTVENTTDETDDELPESQGTNTTIADFDDPFGEESYDYDQRATIVTEKDSMKTEEDTKKKLRLTKSIIRTPKKGKKDVMSCCLSLA